jgi:hypothetical protein
MPAHGKHPRCRGNTTCAVSYLHPRFSMRANDSSPWRTRRAAHTAFSCASMEPAYLNTAFVASETALTLDTLVDPDLLSFSGPSRLGMGLKKHSQRSLDFPVLIALYSGGDERACRKFSRITQSILQSRRIALGPDPTSSDSIQITSEAAGEVTSAAGSSCLI